MSTDPPLVLPSELPWAQLSGEPLEELLFWLCDALGAKDLEWRAGSVSGTSPDRGRDLEATFHLSGPDGELVPERWWIQAKGRSRTVEPAAVKQALLDAQSDPRVDVLVIATNSRFSNDTRDAVHRAVEARPRPRARLWDRSQLERMLVKHPSVVARVAPEALSDAGRLSALTERFWARLDLAPRRILERLWSARDTLEVDHNSAFALLCSEAGNGDLDARPWGTGLSDEVLQDLLVLGLANLPGLLMRTESFGGSWDPPRIALAYVVGCCLLRFDLDPVAEILDNPWRHVDLGEGRPRNVEAWRPIRDEVVNPTLSELRDLLVRPCVSDCVRVSADFEDRANADVARRWDRFLPADVSPVPPVDGRMLVIENLKKPCRAGLSLGEDRRCPFFDGERTWQERLSDFQDVLVNRVHQRRHERSESPEE